MFHIAQVGMPHFTVLCFISLCRYGIFSKLKICGNSAHCHVMVSIFSTNIFLTPRMCDFKDIIFLCMY